MRNILPVCLAIILTFSSQGLAQNPKGCLSCHEGIEDISPKMQPVIDSLGGGRGRSCVVCHMGNPDAATKEEAHNGLIPNPSDLRVVEKTCGRCHSSKADLQKVVSKGETNHVDRVFLSPMANNPGGISGGLYSNSYTDEKLSSFTLAPHPVRDETGKELKTLPEDGHLAIEMLRKFCLKCHLWGKGDQKAMFFRSTGCAACHMPTADDGTYQGGDPTMKGKVGYSRTHQITTQIPSSQCARCHKGGNRIGVSYTGELKGHIPDIHFERGIQCIDCHLSKEVHGDGNIYIKKWQAVKIRCEGCHGTPNSLPTMKAEDGTPLPNLVQEGDKYILVSKYDERRHPVPVLKAVKDAGVLATQMEIPQHMEKMECFACHGTKQVNCYGCHLTVDRRKMGRDLLTGKESPGAWSMETAAQKWKDTILGVNQRGKVAPFQLGCAVNFTEIDEKGNVVRDFMPFTKKDGTPGYVRVSAHPHTIQRRGMRGCNDCHNSNYVMGFGGEKVETYPSGRAFTTDPDRMVDEKGNPKLLFSQPGQGPLTKEVIARMKRVGECTVCHEKEKAPFWLKFEESYRWVKDRPKEHRAKVDAALKR